MKASLLLLPALLLVAGSAHAQTLTISQPYQYAGLIFDSALTFDQTSTIIKPISLHFDSTNVLDVQPTTKQNIAVETIVPPSPTPTVTPTPTSLPTATPTPTVTSTPPPTVTTSPSNPGGLNADVLFSMVNSYRATKNLPAFQKDDKTCSLAASRAPEIGEEITNGHMHSGLRDRNLPYWNTENIISMRNETEAFNWWINDQIHKEAIESNNTFSCMACSGNSCAEEFTNYQPR